MKNYRKTVPALLCAAVLLIVVFMTGCTKPSEAPHTTFPESAESDHAAADGVASSPSDAPDATADVPPALTLPIPDEIDATDPEAWKTEFEKSLFENYGATPHHYEDLGDGVYQVYVEIEGKIVPYVAVDSKTGDYHG